MAGSPVWDACFFVYYFMDEEKVMNEREKVNQITEGVIWKQLLLFFFPIVFGTFFQQIYNTADTIVVGRFVGKQALAAVGECKCCMQCLTQILLIFCPIKLRDHNCCP